jgi:hypothetical protein
VLGIIPGALVGVIIGLVALAQIRRTGQDGYRMAVAGLVLSGIWTVVFGTLLVVAIVNAAQHNSTTTGQAPTSGTVASSDLQPGDCLNGLREHGDVGSLSVVPCAQPHQGEVFAVFDLAPGPFPGKSNVHDEAGSGCNDRFSYYSSVDPSNEGWYIITPEASDWNRGDRRVTCIASPSADGLTTGSIRSN